MSPSGERGDILSTVSRVFSQIRVTLDWYGNKSVVYSLGGFYGGNYGIKGADLEWEWGVGPVYFVIRKLDTDSLPQALYPILYITALLCFQFQSQAFLGGHNYYLVSPLMWTWCHIMGNSIISFTWYVFLPEITLPVKKIRFRHVFYIFLLAIFFLPTHNHNTYCTIRFSLLFAMLLTLFYYLFGVFVSLLILYRSYDR